MSFKEIKELRKAGKLEDALQMAERFLEEDPENIWNKRAITWVYYDYLKKYAQVDSYDYFKEYLIKINNLELPNDEEMLFDGCAWQIGKLVYALKKVQPIDLKKINELFSIIKDIPFSKPSKPFSYLYKAFHQHYKNWSNYLEFADWWEFKNFLSGDYIKEEYNGKKIMALAEQAYIAYSKKLLEGEPIDPFGQQRKINKEKIQSFLPHLDNLIEKHPEYQYPPYFKAKLLLTLGTKKNVLSAFLPFAKQKRNDFWVWELMAEISSEKKDIQFACYCKALSMKTSEDFLIKLRQTFAAILIEKRMYDEAKTEIEKAVETYKKQEWKLPHQINKWTEQEWYNSATAQKNNMKLYEKHIQTAEEILFKDIPEEVIVVEFVNKNKNIINFIKDKNKHGFFNYHGKLTKPKIGDILKVRFKPNSENNFFNILTVKKAQANTKTDAIKNFEGQLKIINTQNFGFVEKVYVEPNFIKNNNLVKGDFLKGSAVLSFNKKKNDWGWKAIKINTPTKKLKNKKK